MIQACLVLHNIAICRCDFIDPNKVDALPVEDDTDHDIMSDEEATMAGKAVRDFYANRYFSHRQ